jgi:hypothetical protein
MDSISRINGLPLSEEIESQTEIQQNNTPAAQPAVSNAESLAGETTSLADNVVPFDSNPFESLFALNTETPASPQVPPGENQFNSSGAVSGSTSVLIT